jgi:hypothetical protein
VGCQKDGLNTKEVVLSASPLLVLLVEFLGLSFYPLLPYTGPNVHLAVFTVTLENSSRWIITRDNPAGQLTAFLVFDGWTNVENLLLALLTVVASLAWLPLAGRKYLSWSFLAATNLAGLASPSMVYLFPPSNFGSWGMSAATFGALGFAVVCSGFILRFAFANFSTRKGNTEYRRPRNFLLLILTLTMFLLSLEYLQGIVSADQIVYAVHSVSALIGGLFGISVMCRIKSAGEKGGGGRFSLPVY